MSLSHSIACTYRRLAARACAAVVQRDVVRQIAGSIKLMHDADALVISQNIDGTPFMGRGKCINVSPAHWGLCEAFHMLRQCGAAAVSWGSRHMTDTSESNACRAVDCIVRDRAITMRCIAALRCVFAPITCLSNVCKAL